MFDRAPFRLIRYSRLGLGLTISLSIVSGLLLIAQAWLLSTIVDRVFLGGQGLSQVLPLFYALLLVALFRAGAAAAGDWVAGSVAGRVKQDLRRALFEHLLALGPEYAHGERTGELSTTAIDGVEAVDAYFSQYLPQLVIAVLVPLAIVLVVFPLDLLSALVLLFTAPSIPFFMILIGKSVDALTRRQYDLLSRLGAHFLDTLQGLATLKQMNRSKGQAATIAQVSERYAGATLSVLRVAFLSALVLEIVATISTAIVAVEVGLRLLDAQIGFQSALFILILAPEFYLPIRMLGLRFHAAASGASAARRILSILQTPVPAAPSGSRPVAVPTRQIEFRNVAFSYAGRTAGLHQVSFTLCSGQTVALFGPSGSGKSTIVRLLLNFCQPVSGEILIDGIPLTALDADAWREQIAWVPQQPHLFSGTIEENIRFARPSATTEEVIQAARAAHLDEFVQTLPDKYRTAIGEEGARLSSGQAQRLALARAFLKDSPILILDEPTSNVDPETEALLRDSTERLMQGRTVLVIAHRLSTIYRADMILVLSDGRVVESGRHAALMQRDGLYRRIALGAAET